MNGYLQNNLNSLQTYHFDLSWLPCTSLAPHSFVVYPLYISFIVEDQGLRAIKSCSETSDHQETKQTSPQSQTPSERTWIELPSLRTGGQTLPEN